VHLCGFKILPSHILPEALPYAAASRLSWFLCINCGIWSDFFFEMRKNANIQPMKINMKYRRRILQALAISGTLPIAGWPLTTLAAGNALASEKITDRLIRMSGAGGNVVLYLGNDNASVIDSGSSEHAQSLISLISELADSKPIMNLFNTHWHDDHTGGNELFHSHGVNIIAHENTRLWLGADFDVEWRNWTHKPRPAEALPDETFYFSGTKDLGGEIVQYHHYEQAHTDGDIALFFPDSNVLVAGGLLSDGRYPTPDIATGGWIGGLIRANEAMLELVDDNTLIIPDQGSTKTRSDLLAQHAMLSDLYEKMKTLARQGYSAQNMLEANVTEGYDEAWGDPEEFILEAYRGMWAHSRDMGGFI
jgi:cyclase